jgi:imidazolonepropionase-like amidohydrolase
MTKSPVPNTTHDEPSKTVKDKHFRVHTSLLFDPQKKAFLKDVSITVDAANGLISEVYVRKQSLPNEITRPDIDLRGLTVLPGLCDAHTHIFLHAYSETPAFNQMRDESFVERVVRATNHVRNALMAGYTTYRDLGTEGMGDADVSFRDTINRGIIPGPRLYVASQIIAASGGYEIRQENALGGAKVPSISDPADGIGGVRAAVRRRLGVGADIIKVYADYRRRELRFPLQTHPGSTPIEFPPSNRNPNILQFTQDEMNTIVEEAQLAQCPIAAHAGTDAAVIMASRAGVTTVEHGNEMSNDGIKAMKEHDIIYVPTLAVIETIFPAGLEKLMRLTKTAFDMGVKLAAGGDTGAFAHGDNVRELELMLTAGIPLVDVLTAATIRGWEACGGDLCGRKFGSWESGSAADITALDGDLRSDYEALRKVSFVMKDGRVYKQGGMAVDMVYHD